MKAAFFFETGGPDTIQYADVPDPTVEGDEVLVRVEAVSINPIDTYIRSGAVEIPLPKPYIVGCDLAGTVEQVGPEVTRFQQGDRVWGSNQGLMGRQGTFAQFACTSQDWLYPIVDGVSAETAAGGSLVGITAHLGLFRSAQLHSGETVFVNGGTGGVGSMVVQMSKGIGAKVVTTVGSDEKAEIVRGWGADLVINYKTENVAEKVLDFSSGAGVNVWFETLREPDFEKTIGLLSKRGRMVVMAGRAARPEFPVGPFYVKDLSLHGFAMFNASPLEQRAAADEINRWLAEKKLEVLIGRQFPIAEAAAAHQLQESNTLQQAGTLMGKIVLKP